MKHLYFDRKIVNLSLTFALGLTSLMQPQMVHAQAQNDAATDIPVTQQMRNLPASQRGPFLIRQLDQLPPEKTVEVLNAARANITKLQEQMIRFQNELIETQASPVSNSTGEKVFAISSDVLALGVIGMGATAAWNLARTFFHQEGFPLLNMVARPKTIEARFFWTSAALTAIGHFTPYLISQRIEINEKEVKALQEQIKLLQSEITREQELIGVLFAVYDLEAKSRAAGAK